MKARQYARMLEFEDEESGLRIKRLWSFHDPRRGRRFYADILEMPDDRRRRLIRQYARFLKQLRTVRRAMADYFAGQQFFDFYPGEPEDDDEAAESARAEPSRRDRQGPRPPTAVGRASRLPLTGAAAGSGQCGSSSARRTDATRRPTSSRIARDDVRHLPDRADARHAVARRARPLRRVRRPVRARDLMDALNQLAEEYERAQADPAFQAELDDYLTHYVGRPSPLFLAERLSRAGRRRADLPEARGPEPHRRPQDQQRASARSCSPSGWARRA